MRLEPDITTLEWEIGCAICGPESHRPGEPLLLSRGITVWLCSDHLTSEYRLRQGGIVFVDALRAVWEAACGLTVRRQEALSAHLRWVRQVMETLRPPTFIEPWLGPRQPPRARQRPKRTGAPLQGRPPVLRPVTPPQPERGKQPPPDRDQPPPPAGAPVRPPRPPRRPPDSSRARPEDEPP